MRAVFFLLFMSALAADAPGAPVPWTHTRPTSPAARYLLQLATERSTSVRALVRELERTDLVVFLMFDVEAGGGSTPDYMTFLTDAAGSRLVLVRIYRRSDPLLAYVPTLAHELQHALELAAAPDVRDRETFARLFATIGWRTGGGQFETGRARAIEQHVRQELSGCRRQGARAQPR